jgi:carboxypeptidase Taq
MLNDYEKLHALSRHTAILQGITHILDWDQETYMPPGGAAIRAEQIKTLAGLVHREKTSRKFANALSKLIDISSGHIIATDLSPAQKAAVKEWHRDYIKDTALPAKFVEEFAKLTSQSILVWRAAKKENAFHQFAPYLDRIISMSRQKADLLGYKKHPYDALLDIYEPDMTTQEVEKIFSQLRDQISPFIKKITSNKQIDDHFLYGEWDKQKQIIFSHQLLEIIGYPMDKGRLDFSAHPFSSASHPTDSRITTRLGTSLMTNIGAVLHEAGHGLYEMGLPQEAYGSPLGESRSLGIHESQSRFWETRIGLSYPFWEHFFPILKKTFDLQSVSLDAFYRAIHKVEPSFIRIEADELTYPLHIIIRFEIEKALIEGSLTTRQIPEAWNAKMQSYLHITPKNYAEGCLQDIHWSMGGFGYFPTYTLGNLYAAQLFEKCAQDFPNWDTRISHGEFTFIKDWLHEHIYQHGRRYSSHELIKKATGSSFSAHPYIEYLKNKYSQIYNLK